MLIDDPDINGIQTAMHQVAKHFIILPEDFLYKGKIPDSGFFDHAVRSDFNSGAIKSYSILLPFS